MRRYMNLPYADRNPLLNVLDVYLPDEGSRFPVFLYFHGGGLVHANHKICGDPFVKFLIKNGVAVVSAAYHLFPCIKGQHHVKYPMFLEDAADAVAWVKEHIGEYCEMERFFIGGSSNGAYLSAMLCLDKSWLGKHGFSPLDIDGFVHDCAQLTAHYAVLKEKGLAHNRVIIDESAPLFHVGTEEQYPPMLFLASSQDGQTRLSQTKLMFTALKNLGHKEPKVQFEVLQGTHCSHVSRVEETGESVFGKKILDFMQSQMA